MKTIAWLSCALGLSLVGILLAQEKEQPATFAALLRVGDHVTRTGTAVEGYSLQLLTDERLAMAKDRYRKRDENAAELKELQSRFRRSTVFQTDATEGTVLQTTRAREGKEWTRYQELLSASRHQKVHRIIATGSDYIGLREFNSKINEFIPFSRIAIIVSEVANAEKE
jgi:hypothetical protein